MDSSTNTTLNPLELPATVNEQNQVKPAESGQSYTIAKLTGTLYWVNSSVSANRYVVITPSMGERDEDGNIPNRGIILSRDASQIFNQEYMNTIFDGDYISIGIRTLKGTTLEQNLASGYGLQGKPNRLYGMSIELA